LKNRLDPKEEAALDRALADTFPASDPVSAIQPVSAGLGWNAAPDGQPPANSHAPQRKRAP